MSAAIKTANATIKSSRIDALKVGTFFAFAGHAWQYNGKNRGAGGLSNVTDAHGARTMLPASTLVRIVNPRRKSSHPAKAKVRR